MKKYEIGYLLSPLIPEEKLDGDISALRKLIEDRQGLITNEERGKMRKLAYNIHKPALGKLDSAYFGWMKFVANPEVLLEIKNFLDKEPNLVRFLLIESAKEEIARKPARKITRPAGNREEKTISKTQPKVKTEIKEEEIDKKLEELLKA